MTFTEQFLAETSEIIRRVDIGAVEAVASLLAACGPRAGASSSWAWAAVPPTRRTR